MRGKHSVQAFNFVHKFSLLNIFERNQRTLCSNAQNLIEKLSGEFNWDSFNYRFAYGITSPDFPRQI